MEKKDFAAYKYGSGVGKNGLMAVAVILSLIAIFICSSAYSPFCMFFLVLPAWLIFCIFRSKYDSTLMLANRYLILGAKIIYFRNVKKAELDDRAQTLTIYSNKGKELVIAAESFPTNARKANKIKSNKTAKFKKISGKIIAKLRATSPDIVIS